MTRKGARNSAPESEAQRSVDPKTGIGLLKRQIGKGQEMLQRRPLHSSDHTAWNNTTRDYLVKVFGSASPNVGAVIHASSDHGLYMGMGDEEFEEYGSSQLANQIKMLESCIEQLETEIELSGAKLDSPSDKVSSTAISSRVFVVHGHNHGIKESVARFLEKLGLDPVILHEKPNAGRTIIEKFSDYSDVQFSVVLLTADDEGKARGEINSLRPRARQNVILELGYFLGRLGRPRVCALYESGVEIPSDYQGVLFVPLDPQNKWKIDLVQELKAAGFDVDANKVFSAD
jgi:predicted nucleotide-binding protein